MLEFASTTGKTEVDVKNDKKIKDQILIFNPDTGDTEVNTIIDYIKAENKAYVTDIDDPEKLLAHVKKAYFVALQKADRKKYIKYGVMGLVGVLVLGGGYIYYKNKQNTDDTFNLRE